MGGFSGPCETRPSSFRSPIHIGWLTVTRLCRAEILNNQSCRRGARCDVCGGYGGYGATIITALDQRISQETKGNRREDRERCAAEDGEQNRSSLLKRVSAFASRNPPIPVTPRKRSEANCSPQDSFIGRDETNHCPLQSPSSTPAECGEKGTQQPDGMAPLRWSALAVMPKASSKQASSEMMEAHAAPCPSRRGVPAHARQWLESDGGCGWGCSSRVSQSWRD